MGLRVGAQIFPDFGKGLNRAIRGQNKLTNMTWLCELNAFARMFTNTLLTILALQVQVMMQRLGDFLSNRLPAQLNIDLPLRQVESLPPFWRDSTV